MGIRRIVLLVLAALVLGGAGVVAYIVRGHPAEGTPYTIPRADRGPLERVADARVFFAHQSVGSNILDAVPGLYRAEGLAEIPIVESSSVATTRGIQHMRVGKNGDPLGKIAEFDRVLRSGVAAARDVAILKLCYVDFDESTDVDKVFAAYRDTLAQLATDYPRTTFIAATVPVTTDRGAGGRIKAALGKGDNLVPERNVVRERFNALMRGEYTRPGTLFDVAAIESTTPDGERVAGYLDGQLYYAMAGEYAKDTGHLNAVGGKAAASGFLSTIATGLEQ